MASNISTTNIDTNFPIAGQDNDSQGFRDNYNIIKTNFDYAKTEIETLQTTTAKLNQENVFNGTLITNAVLSQTAELFFDAGVTDTASDPNNIELSYANGQYQKITVANNTTLKLVDWIPGERYSYMRVEITGVAGNTTTRTVAWASENNGTIKYANNANGATVTNDSVIQIFEF